MSQHFLCYRDLVTATAVHHTAFGYLTCDSKEDLVVVTPQCLHIYHIESFPQNSKDNIANGNAQNTSSIEFHDTNGRILRLLASFPLAGTVESLSIIRYDRRLSRRHKEPQFRFNGGTDVLLLSFPLYKWAIVGFDRKTQTLTTLAMYSFADDWSIGPGTSLKGEKNGREQLLGLSTKSVIHMDPKYRCGAMLIYNDQLVIVPFKSESMDANLFEDEEEDDDEGDELEKDNSNEINNDDEEEEDEEEKELMDLVKVEKLGKSNTTTNEQTSSSGNETNSDVVKQKLASLLDKSVKIGAKRKRSEKDKTQGLMYDDLTGREFLLRLRELDIKGKIIDLTFLHGYLEPTLVILHEDNANHTTSGRFAAGYATHCLTVISLNLTTRMHPRIWHKTNLPSDTFKLVACPSGGGGGVLVLSTNAILYFNQTQFIGLATNSFAAKIIDSSPLTFNTTPPKVPLWTVHDDEIDMTLEQLNTVLYDCQMSFLTNSDLLLVPASGELLLLTVPLSKNQDSRLSLCKLSYPNLILKPKAITSLSWCEARKVVFIGSRSGDSCMYALETHSIKFNQKELLKQSDISVQSEFVDDADSNGMNNASSFESKITNGKHDVDIEMNEIDDDDDDDEDDFLYGSASTSTVKADKEQSNVQLGVKADTNSAWTFDSHSYMLSLRFIDAFQSLGQITDMELGIESNTDSIEKREELLLSGGFDHNGSISILHNGLRPIVNTEAELSGCRAMWTVYSSKSRTETLLCHAYLILSVSQRTMVLRTGEELRPLEDDSGFYTSGPTLSASNLFKNERIVQVFKAGVRVMSEIHEDRIVPQQPSDDDTEAEDDDEEAMVRMICTQEITLEGDIESGGMGVNDDTIIISVDTLDPYIICLLSDGTLRILQGDNEDLELSVLDPTKLIEEAEPVSTSSTICAACLFHDYACMFQGSENVPNKKSTRTSHLLLQADSTIRLACCFEDGSLRVYSLPEIQCLASFPNVTYAPQTLVNSLENESAGMGPNLGLYNVANQKNTRKQTAKASTHTPVADVVIHRVGPSEGQLNAQEFSYMVLLLYLANGDLLMYKASPRWSLRSQQTPIQKLQFVRISSDLITRPVAPSGAKHKGIEAQAHNNIPIEKGSTADTSKNSAAQLPQSVMQKFRSGFRYPMLTKFSHVNHESGVFFRGAHPMWVMSVRGFPTFVPLSVSQFQPKDGISVAVPVLSFTPFHHWNCPNGFIFYHSKGVVRICELPSWRNTTVIPASNGFVLQKINFGASIHQILYLGNKGPGGVADALSKLTYAIVCSVPMSPEAIQAATDTKEDGTPMVEEYEEDPNENLDEDGKPQSQIMAPTAELLDDMTLSDLVETNEELYELRIIQIDKTLEHGFDWTPDAFEGVFRVYFERFEVVLSVKLMYLVDSTFMKQDELLSTSKEFHTKKRPYLVVGTGFVGPHGEDESGRGRLLLYEVDYAQYVDEEGGDTSTKLPKLKLLFIKDHRQGAISQVCQLGPYVLAAVGSKLIVYELKSEQLVGCAFYDAQIYIVSISVLKEFILYGDIYRSIHFVRWKEKQRQLVLLAKDYEPLAIVATEFNVYGKKLAMLASDIEENIHLMQFAPRDIESRGGQRLLRTSDFHIGMQTSSIFRKCVNMFLENSVQSNGSALQSTSPVYINVLGSTEGAIAALIPIAERVFRRLFTLQNVMANTLPQHCGLNPRDFRAIKTNGRQHSGRKDGWCKRKWSKSILDGRVLSRFMHIDYVAQKELTRCIGTTPDVVIQNLLDIQRYSASFL